jgi:hypothetical protein
VSYLGSEVDQNSGLSTLSFSKPVGFGSIPPLHRWHHGPRCGLVRRGSERPAKPQREAFRPQAGFKEFYFDETGDTNATSLENAIGGWTGVFKLRQKDPSADSGTLSLFYKGDAAHAGFDNVTFISRDQISFVEDAGATLHGQRNALDSGFVLNVKTNYGNPANQPIRWLAQGRDASATHDAANAGFGSNEDDNEITGILVSNGDPDPDGILGEKSPKPFKDHWRWFYTQQHGDNPTYEVIPAEDDGPGGS